MIDFINTGNSIVRRFVTINLLILIEIDYAKKASFDTTGDKSTEIHRRI